MAKRGIDVSAHQGNIDLVTLNQSDSIEIEYNKENETEKIIPILKVK